MQGEDFRKLFMPSGWRGMGTGLAAAMLASLAGLPFRGWTDPDNLTMLYLTAVVVVALKSGLGPAMLCAVSGVAAFNFLFTPPYYTFETLSPASYLTFGIMLVSSLLAAVLASGLSARLTSANRGYSQTRHLLDIAQDLLQAADREAVEASLARTMAERFGAHALLLAVHDVDPAADAALSREVPLKAGDDLLGVLRLERLPGAPPLEPPDELELETMAALAAGALMRIRQAELVTRTRADKEAERLRNLLLSSLGHDLRTPLTVLSGTAAGLLRMRRKLPREALEDVQVLSRQISDLQRFVANLLRIAAISSGQLKLNREPYDMQEILGAALKRLEELLGTRRVHIEISGALPLVEIDGALVEQVIVNLLENAVRHTASTGTITVLLERHEGMLRTAISDDGPGLPEGEEERIFNRFQTAGTQAGSTGPVMPQGNPGPAPDRKAGGHGLGLAICRGIVEAHGGRILASNRADGHGATFRFTLPFAARAGGTQ